MPHFPAAIITLSMTIPILLAIMFLSSTAYADELSTDFYSDTCPNISSIVLKVLKPVIENETRMGASLLRLHFHDCFVNGCDGSILLDNKDPKKSEKQAGPNLNSARGFEIIDKVKEELEKECRDVVSCADIIAVVAKESVCLLGGPEWKVKFGRRDSLKAKQSDANSNIPSPALNLDQLVERFEKFGLSQDDFVALSGAHSIGDAKCTSFRDRIYNETETIDKSFAKKAKKNCRRNSTDDNNLEGLDYQSSNKFDNDYYKNIREKRGLLHSDQQLQNTSIAKYENITQFVKIFSEDQDAFYKAFASAMVNMGDIGPLTGDKGEIRKNCRKPNKN